MIDHDDYLDGTDDLDSPHASPSIHSTESIINSLASSLRSVLGELPRAKVTATAVMVLDRFARDWRSTDPDSLKILRRLAVARGRSLMGEGKGAAKLANDPTDPAHDSWLMVIPDAVLRKAAARADTREGMGGNGMPDGMVAMLGSVERD